MREKYLVGSRRVAMVNEVRPRESSIMNERVWGGDDREKRVREKWRTIRPSGEPSS